MTGEVNLDKPHNLSKAQLENSDNFPYLVGSNEIRHKKPFLECLTELNIKAGLGSKFGENDQTDQQLSSERGKNEFMVESE